MKLSNFAKRDAITYRLLSLRRTAAQGRYLLIAQYRDDCICLELEEDELRSKAAYERIVQGSVTPVSVQDVLEDLGIPCVEYEILNQDVVPLSLADSESVRAVFSL